MTVLPLSDDGGLIIASETTLERNLRDALIDTRQRYKGFAQCLSNFSWETNRNGQFVFVSPGGALGYLAKQLTGLDPRDLIDECHQDTAPLPFHSIDPCEARSVWLRSSDGAPARL